MDAILSKLPIDEDPRIIEDVLDRFEEQLAQIDVLSEKFDGSEEHFSDLEGVRDEIRVLFSMATSTNIPPIVEPLEILCSVYGYVEKSVPDLAWLLQATVALLDRIDDMLRVASRQGAIDIDLIQTVQTALAPLARANDQAQVIEASKTVVNLLIGDFSKDTDDSLGVDLFDEDQYVDNKVEIPRSDVDRSTVSFMRLLAETVDARHEFWRGRTEKVMSMAVGMNALAGNVVDVFQLEAAVYLHDFPMVRLCDDLLVKTKLNNEEFEKIKAHPAQAYEFALTLPNLEECAKIVYQHHERVDGNGYPERITGQYISDGAKILAICDAFYSMTHSTPNKPLRKSILRAVIEISACSGKQFDPFWVEKFNRVVKAQRLGGFL